MEKIFHFINGSWVGFKRTNGRGGVSRWRVERELVKYNHRGPDMGAVEGPRSADDAPAVKHSKNSFQQDPTKGWAFP